MIDELHKWEERLTLSDRLKRRFYTQFIQPGPTQYRECYDREFRAKRIDNREWIYGSLVILDEEHEYIVPIPKCDVATHIGCNEIPQLVMVAIDPRTVGQCVLKNKRTGQKLYQGDIVVCVATTCECHSPKIGTVCYSVPDGKNQIYIFRENDFIDIPENFFIVGDVYNNANLLLHYDKETLTR